MLKAGVLGAGHLGKIHLKLLQQSERYELVGFMVSQKQWRPAWLKNLVIIVLKV